MTPGDIMIHHSGRTVGIVGEDGKLYTHNMDLDDHEARNFTVCDASDVPDRISGMFAAARRRAARQAGFGEPG